MRKIAAVTALMTVFLALACGPALAQHDELAYIAAEEELPAEVVDGFDSPDDESDVDVSDLWIDSDQPAGEDPSEIGAETLVDESGIEAQDTASETLEDESEGGVEADAIPAFSGLLVRETDLPGDIAPPVHQDPLESSLHDELGAVLDRPRQVDVAEEACYVRVMSDEFASVREVRSFDLYPGTNELRLVNIPVSILEDSIFLSVWHPESEVAIKNHRLVRLPESAELLVEVSSSDRVVGASLEVLYLTDDLRASLSYSGMYDSEAASLRLVEWLTVANDCGKSFSGAAFSFDLSELGFRHRISSAVTLPTGEQSRFLCSDNLLSPATTIVKAENDQSGDPYDIIELIKVEGLRDQDLLIPRSPATIYSMDTDGFGSLIADDFVDKPRDYSWFTVETLNRPDVEVQRVQTGDEVTGEGIRDVSYMINISNRSSEDVIVTIYEWIGGNWTFRSASVDAGQVLHSSDPERREYATFTIGIAANSSRALLYKVRVSQRPER